MALKSTTIDPDDRREDVYILDTVWKASQARASDDGMRFSDAVNRLIHEVVTGSIGIDPREDIGRRAGRGNRGIYPDPDEWGAFRSFAESIGMTYSRALELLLMRHGRGDFGMKVVVEFREKKGVKNPMKISAKGSADDETEGAAA